MLKLQSFSQPESEVFRFSCASLCAQHCSSITAKSQLLLSQCNSTLHESCHWVPSLSRSLPPLLSRSLSLIEKSLNHPPFYPLKLWNISCLHFLSHIKPCLLPREVIRNNFPFSSISYFLTLSPLSFVKLHNGRQKMIFCCLDVSLKLPIISLRYSWIPR